MYKFRQALAEDGDSDLPENKSEELNKTTPVGKKMLAAKKRNEAAMANSTILFTTEGTTGLVLKASTTD